MKVLENISDFFGRYMALIVLVIAALALLVPESCLWVQTSWVNYLLMVVMFGMGLTLKLEDFKLVFTRPKDIIVGCVAQFTVMPLLALALGKVFRLDPALLAGVVLVGTCPGGTSSNVITYLSKGDVALSVGMTSVNTLLAPFLTPAITYLLLKTTVTVDPVSMFLSIIKVVIVPIALGFIINKLWGKTSSGKLDNSLYIIESSKIREEIKKALAAVDAIKAEEFKFLNENILPLLCEQIGTDDLQK